MEGYSVPHSFHLASLGRPRVCGGFFFQDERVQIITHVRPGKKTTTHWGRPREAKRTHPMYKLLLITPSFE